MGMTEKIGGITLDYSKYPGEDLYCDGAVEDELLALVQRLSPGEYAGAIEEKGSWPILYHLSPLRENMVDWIPLTKNDKVLEVGSGCGAVTGSLAARAGSVTCVDLSKKRSLINAYRHKDCENVTIHVGNFKDVEPQLEADYDYICLIGVFEYGQAYIGGETPYEDFLKILMRHLAPGGRIIIAIENKYGLKYFAGCKEDHLGTWFSGIENYPQGGCVRTFSRRRLEKIFKACGVEEYAFYYPYPDYKFMTMLYSDVYLPGKGELSNNMRNFDRDRMLLFDEKSAFDGIVEEGLFSVFANSYAAVIGKSFPVKFVKYSNDRAPQYRIKTVISKNEQGGVMVCKYPIGQEAVSHVRQMAAAYEDLTERYRGGRLSVNTCRLVEENGGVYASFDFVQGRPLSELMDECLDRQDMDGFRQLFLEYVERVGYNEDYPVADFDLIFSNILVQGDTWTLIDYEWTFGKPMATKELAFRAVYCYLLEDEKRDRLQVDWILETLGITEAEAAHYREQEMDFQRFVTGERASMGQLREKVGGEVLKPMEWVDRYRSTEGILRVQIYEDRGQGFSEAQSYFLPDAYRTENRAEFTLRADRGVKRLRIDPALCPCICKVDRLCVNGEEIPLGGRKGAQINGRLFKAAQNGEGPSIVFATDDPNITVQLEGRQTTGTENELTVMLEVACIPMAVAKDLKGDKRKGAII